MAREIRGRDTRLAPLTRASEPLQSSCITSYGVVLHGGHSTLHHALALVGHYADLGKGNLKSLSCSRLDMQQHRRVAYGTVGPAETAAMAPAVASSPDRATKRSETSRDRATRAPHQRRAARPPLCERQLKVAVWHAAECQVRRLGWLLSRNAIGLRVPSASTHEWNEKRRRRSPSHVTLVGWQHNATATTQRTKAP